MKCVITYKQYDPELAEDLQGKFNTPAFAAYRDSSVLCEYDTVEELFDALITIEKRKGCGLPCATIGKYKIVADKNGSGLSRIYVFGS
jgi:hypothetical protein